MPGAKVAASCAADGTKPSDSFAFVFAGVLWLALLFGLLEGLEYAWFRYHPVILMTLKVDLSILWITPIVYFICFALLLLGGWVVQLIYRRFPLGDFVVLGSVWMGVYGFATLAKKIHYAGAAVFALGIAVCAVRWMRGRPGLWLTMRRWAAAPVAAVALLALAVQGAEMWRERAAVAALPAAAPGAPNVLFIVLDTVRADHMSAAGYERPTTPFIAELGQRGVTFDRAWSTTSWTFPAHASMFTGRPAYEHRADRDRYFDDKYPVLAEALSSRGYLTGAFSGNFGFVLRECGFARGFSHFSAYTPYLVASRTAWGRKAYSQMMYEYGFTGYDARYRADAINRDLLRWLEKRDGRPFFAFVNYFDAHDPYWLPAGFKNPYAGQTPPAMLPIQKEYQADINTYDALVNLIDRNLRTLFGELEQRGLLSNTIVVITADHGESLGEHDKAQHGDTLYREESQVHLLVIAPGKMPAGARSSAAVSVQQIPATIADLAGAKDSPLPGVSLRRSFELGDQQAPDDVVLAELQWRGAIPAMKSLISKDWQFIWNIKAKTAELYHLPADPRQLQNVVEAPENRELVQRRVEQLRAIFPDLGLPAGQRVQAPPAGTASRPAGGSGQ